MPLPVLDRFFSIIRVFSLVNGPVHQLHLSRSLLSHFQRALILRVLSNHEMLKVSLGHLKSLHTILTVVIRPCKIFISRVFQRVLLPLQRTLGLCWISSKFQG